MAALCLNCSGCTKESVPNQRMDQHSAARRRQS
jgi:hypothetical protein